MDRILKGAKPGPSRRPQLVVNVKAAAALRLTMPPLILACADYIIE